MEKVYLTREGYKKLIKELKELKKKRRVIAKRIEEARGLGDLSENADYIEAKEDQALNEGHILEIENTLKNYEIIKSKKTGKIEIGSKFVVRDEENKLIKFRILGGQESDPAKGIISNNSPLGQAFLGKRKNEVVIFKTPIGKMRKFKIVKIS